MDKALVKDRLLCEHRVIVMRCACELHDTMRKCQPDFNELGDIIWRLRDIANKETASRQILP